jgi:hypothetical protein
MHSINDMEHNLIDTICVIFLCEIYICIYSPDITMSAGCVLHFVTMSPRLPHLSFNKTINTGVDSIPPLVLHRYVAPCQSQSVIVGIEALVTHQRVL